MKIYINSYFLLIFLMGAEAYGQITNEYSLNISAKISNQGYGLKPCF